MEQEEEEKKAHVFPFGLRVDALKGGSDGDVDLRNLLGVSLACILIELASRLNRLGDALLERSLLLLETDQSGLEIV